MRIKGTIEAGICDGIKCPLCRYFGSDDYECSQRHDNGWQQLMIVYDFWKVLGENKVEVFKERLAEFFLPDQKLFFISIPTIEKLVRNIDELERELKTFVDIDFRISREKSEEIRKLSYGLVNHWVTEDGKDVYTLVNSWSNAESVRRFFRYALGQNKEIEVEF